MRAVFDILYGWLLVTASSVALGWLLFYALQVRLRKLEHALLAFLVGSAGLSLLMFVLSWLHLVRRGILQAISAVLIAGAFWLWKRSRWPVEILAPVTHCWYWLFLLGFCAYSFVYFFNALAPEVSPDGTGYHLAVVAAYHRAHGFTWIPPTVFSHLPQGLEMLYLFAFAFGRHSAAAMVHFSFLVALPWLVLSFGRRFGLAGAGAFAGLLVFASPVAGIDGISAYNDVALAAAAFGVFYLLQIWDEAREGLLLILVGLLAGFCAALKYTGALVPVYAMGYVAWRSRNHAGRAMARVATLAWPGALVAAPWLVRNWALTGNPVLPLLNRFFPNPYIHPGVEYALRELASHMLGGASRWKGLWDSVAAGSPPGLIGPIFLLSPLALLAFRQPLARRLIAAGAVLLGAFVVNNDARFLIPALVFVTLPLAIVLEKIPLLPKVVAVLHLLLSWYAVMPLYVAEGAWRLDEIPIRAALRIETEDRFFERRLPEYFLSRMIEQRTPPGSAVLAINVVPQAYTTRTIAVGFEDKLSYEMLEWVVRASLPPHDIEECRFDFGPGPWQAIRIVQETTADWRVDEIEFWREESEIPRVSQWLLRAAPNHWDVRLAFDGNPLTWWSPMEPVRPGMSIEASFGAPTRVDAVTLRSAPSQHGRNHILARGDSGGWRKLGSQPVCVSKPLGRGLRRLAIQELKERGVGFLVVKDSEHVGRDLFYNRAYWGVTEIGEWHGGRLYRFN